MTDARPDLPRPSGPPPGPVRAAAVYTALRLGLFAVVLVVALLAGVPSFPALVVALLVSLAASVVLLRRQRDDLARAVLARRERSAARRQHEQRVREHVEQVRRGQDPGGPDPSRPPES